MVDSKNKELKKEGLGGRGWGLVKTVRKSDGGVYKSDAAKIIDSVLALDYDAPVVEKDTDSGVKVSDKRRFSSDGTVRQDVGDDHDKQDHQHSSQDFEINFSTFILSLASSVQISLGLIPHPQTKKAEVNLIAAKQTIDILGMLEEKTKGNLNADETNILKQILFELRMQYVECSKK